MNSVKDQELYQVATAPMEPGLKTLDLAAPSVSSSTRRSELDGTKEVAVSTIHPKDEGAVQSTCYLVPSLTI